MVKNTECSECLNEIPYNSQMMRSSSRRIGQCVVEEPWSLGVAGDGPSRPPKASEKAEWTPGVCEKTEALARRKEDAGPDKIGMNMWIRACFPPVIIWKAKISNRGARSGRCRCQKDIVKWQQDELPLLAGQIFEPEWRTHRTILKKDLPATR